MKSTYDIMRLTDTVLLSHQTMMVQNRKLRLPGKRFIWRVCVNYHLIVFNCLDRTYWQAFCVAATVENHLYSRLPMFSQFCVQTFSGENSMGPQQCQDCLRKLLQFVAACCSISQNLEGPGLEWQRLFHIVPTHSCWRHSAISAMCMRKIVPTT